MMKKLRLILTRLTTVCLCISLLTLTGCASTTQKDAQNNPQLILEQAKKAYFEQKYDVAFQLLYPLAVSGNDQAQYALGYLYHHGLGVEKNEQQAMSWIQRAASQGNKKAQQALQ